MSKKIMLVIIISILIIPLIQCDGNETYNPDINLPFVRCTTGVSAASAIATWSAYDGIWASESYVLASILNADGTVNHTKMVNTVDIVTWSAGWIAEFPATDNGQNQALSGIKESLENDCCSILPLINGHYVPVVSVKGHYDDGKPIADFITFHAYDRPDQGLMANTLKSTYYKPINGKFIAFLGRRIYMNNGLLDYNWFVLNDGTYYGAPTNYEPSNLPIK